MKAVFGILVFLGVCSQIIANAAADSHRRVATRPLRCFTCQGADSPENCLQLTECADDEICYLFKYTDPGDLNNVRYEGGCRKKSFCHEVMCTGKFPDAVIGKRSDQLANCVECCDTDHCNLNLCGVDFSNTLRCYDCDSQSNTERCFNTKHCQPSEQCVVQAYVSVTLGTLYFKQDCHQTLQCGAVRRQVGKRSSGDIQLASSCCNTTLCNDYNPATGSHIPNNHHYDEFLCSPKYTTKAASTTSKPVPTTITTKPAPTTRTTKLFPTTTTTKPVTVTSTTKPVTISTTTKPVSTTRTTKYAPTTTITTKPVQVTTTSRPVQVTTTIKSVPITTSTKPRYTTSSTVTSHLTTIANTNTAIPSNTSSPIPTTTASLPTINSSTNIPLPTENSTELPLPHTISTKFPSTTSSSSTVVPSSITTSSDSTAALTTTVNSETNTRDIPTSSMSTSGIKTSSVTSINNDVKTTSAKISKTTTPTTLEPFIDDRTTSTASSSDSTAAKTPTGTNIVSSNSAINLTTAEISTPSSPASSSESTTSKTITIRTTSPRTMSETTAPNSTPDIPPVSTVKPGSVCNVCDESGSCKLDNAHIVTCPHSRPLCMNSIIYGDAANTKKVRKACASKTECYWKYYIGLKQDPQCISNSTSINTDVCHFCCETDSGEVIPCNSQEKPQKLFHFETPLTGRKCMVGDVSSGYKQVTCSADRPYCMNEIYFIGKQVVDVIKRCENKEFCKADWWNRSRGIPACVTGDTSLNTGSNLICDICCLSEDFQICNNMTSPLVGYRVDFSDDRN